MLAPAKINLTLEVLGKRADGYHALYSLVTFADFGDHLTFTPRGERFTLEVVMQEPCAEDLEQNNLVLRAAHALKEKAQEIGVEVPYGHFTLTKYIPVAAGLGGGSADAAAALRLLTQDKTLQSEVAQKLGADVPVCLESRPRFMGGIGHQLFSPLTLTPFAAVLVNPRQALATKDVFLHLKAPSFVRAPRTYEGGDIQRYIKEAHNDLEAPARALMPMLGTLLQELMQCKGAWLSRLSGSGATCFVLFNQQEEAQAAALELQQKYPFYFVKAVTLHG